jgi:hypothetical protein
MPVPPAFDREGRRQTASSPLISHSERTTRFAGFLSDFVRIDHAVEFRDAFEVRAGCAGEILAPLHYCARVALLVTRGSIFAVIADFLDCKF